MDPITHGITGALLGKGIFSDREGRMATFAATLGSVFPDVDIVAESISRDPLAIVKYHRGITHSFIALPFFAALLAWLTIYFTRRRKIPCPSWPMLTLQLIDRPCRALVLPLARFHRSGTEPAEVALFPASRASEPRVESCWSPSAGDRIRR